MTETDRLWHAVVDWEIALKDAEADCKDARERVAESAAAYRAALIAYRKHLDDLSAKHGVV